MSGYLRSLARVVERGYGRIRSRIRRAFEAGSLYFGNRGGLKSRFMDFESYLNAIKESPWVAVSCFRVGDAIVSALPNLKIFNEDTGEELEDTKHPLAVLLKSKPNRYQSASLFYRQLVFHWKATGNYFILPNPAKGQPVEMFLLLPHRMSYKPDPVTIVGEWIYDIGGGAEKKTYGPEEIIHGRNPHPTEPVWGMGMIEANPRLYNTHIAMDEDRWKKMEHGADFGMILEVDGKIGEPERRRLEAEIEDRYSGSNNAGRPFIATGGMKANRAPTGNEADFNETRKGTRDEQLALGGLMPIQAGVTENANRASAWVQQVEFQKWTVQPALRDLGEVLTLIAKRFGNFRVEFDHMVQEDNLEDSQISANYFGTAAASPNDIREKFLGLPRVKNRPEMDQYYLPVGMIPISEASLPAESPAPAPAPSPETPAAEPKMAPVVISKAGTQLQNRVLRFYLRERIIRERQIRPKVKAFFRGQRDRVIARYLDQAKVYRAKATPANLMDAAAEERTWRRVMNPIQRTILISEFEGMADLFDYTPTTPFEPGAADFEVKLRRLGQRITGVNAFTRDRVGEVVQAGITLGLGPDAIANGDDETGFGGIRGLYSSFEQHRAQLIARTESAAALDQANTQVFAGLGVVQCDVLGCEDRYTMPGQKWGCGDRGIPIAEAELVEFHPNHKGAIVPVLTRSSGVNATRLLSNLDRALTAPSRSGVLAS